MGEHKSGFCHELTVRRRRQARAQPGRWETGRPVHSANEFEEMIIRTISEANEDTVTRCYMPTGQEVTLIPSSCMI